jgi:hypothetical protein
VGVGPLALVFAEVLRVLGLADVVKQGADPGDERMGADGIGGVLGKLDDVVIETLSSGQCRVLIDRLKL